ncbi:MAG: DUF2192 domain-containing protein [Desulfurococcaceae archaeon TW002]
MNAKRRRVKAYVNALSDLISSDNPSRELAIQLIKKYLESVNVEPFRGASKPEDIYEKEMISLYVIATRGLGINTEFKELMSRVFNKELTYEDTYLLLSRDAPPETIREEIQALVGNIDESYITRVLRYALILYHLDFESFEKVIKVLKKAYQVFPEFSDAIRRFAKFVISVKLAEEISQGIIKNKIEKEIRKQLISLEIGLPKSTPSDDYVMKVAKITYEINDTLLSKIFEQTQPPSSKTNESEK